MMVLNTNFSNEVAGSFKKAQDRRNKILENLAELLEYAIKEEDWLLVKKVKKLLKTTNI